MPGPSLLRHPTSKNCPQMTPLASSLPLWPRIPISPLLTPSQLSAPLCLSWHQAVVKIQRQAWKFPQIVLSCSPHWPHLCSGITVPCPRPTRHLLRTLVKSGGGSPQNVRSSALMKESCILQRKDLLYFQHYVLWIIFIVNEPHVRVRTSSTSQLTWPSMVAPDQCCSFLTPPPAPSLSPSLPSALPRSSS